MVWVIDKYKKLTAVRGEGCIKMLFTKSNRMKLMFRTSQNEGLNWKNFTKRRKSLLPTNEVAGLP